MGIKINVEKAQQITAAQAIPEALEKIFMSFSPEERGAFYPLKAGVKLALESGDILAAVAIIQNAPVAEGPLSAARDEMLSLFTAPTESN